MDPFISTDDLEAYLDETLADPNALEVKIALDSACESVRSYVGQTINRATTTEVRHGTGLEHLRLRERPVRAIGAISVDDTPLATDEYILIGSVVWRIDDGWFTFGRANVSVQYDHGYEIEPSGTPADDVYVPSDLRLVALSTAARVYRRFGEDEAYRSENIGQYSYQRDSSSTLATRAGFLEAEAAILDRYAVRLTP